MNDGDKVRVSFDVSIKLNKKLDAIAERAQSSKSDVLRKSINLMEIVIHEIECGNHLHVVSKDNKIVKEIISF